MVSAPSPSDDPYHQRTEISGTLQNRTGGFDLFKLAWAFLLIALLLLIQLYSNPGYLVPSAYFLPFSLLGFSGASWLYQKSWQMANRRPLRVTALILAGFSIGLFVYSLMDLIG